VNIEKKVQSIFTIDHYINLISSFIIWLSGTLFFYKIFEEPFAKIIYYSIAFLLLIILIERAEKIYKSFLTRNTLFLILLILTACAILLYRLEYIGYPSIGGFTIFWIAAIYRTQEVKVNLLQVAIFLLSPVLYLEMISFSGIFALAMMVIVSILLSERFLDARKLDWKFFLLAFLFGATISADYIISVIYIVYLLFVFRANLKNGLIFSAAVILAFFVFMYLGSNGTITLFTSQSGSMMNYFPLWLIIPLVLLTIYIGWMAADIQEVLFSCGIILFSVFVLSLIIKISTFGWNKDAIDFSLVMMAIPFLVLAIKEYKVDRFLGKVF
jgi:hypothetical protein